jgi:hypothetical protein
MDPIFWLLKLFGIKGLTKVGVGIVKWTVRLFLWAVAAYVLYQVFNNVVGIISAAALGLVYVAFRWWRNRQGSTPEEVGERTIDGKTVPDKLAVAAPVVPVQSAGIYDVLRGLPDYGKSLLKLTPGQFDYIPPAPEPAPASPAQEPREEKPAAPKRVSSLTAARVAVMIWLRTAPRRAVWVTAAAAVLVVAGMGAYKEMTFDAWKRGAEQTRQNELNAVTQQLETGKGPEEAKAASLPPNQFDAFLNGLDKNQPQTPSPAPPSSGTDTVQAAGVVWTATDNGRGVNWQEADEYCSGLTLSGRRWRLPTSQELSGVWAETKEPSTRNPGYIGLGHGFRLSGSAAFPMLWSGDGGGAVAKALYAYSEPGLRPEANIGAFRASMKRDTEGSHTITFRAVCVGQ